MISITMDQKKFDKVKSMLSNNKAITASAVKDANNGSFSTSQVSMDYQFNPTQEVLSLNVTARHGAAHFATDSVISEHINELLNGVVF